MLGDSGTKGSDSTRAGHVGTIRTRVGSSLEDARSGRDFDGNRLSTGERVFRGALGSFELGTTAFGLKTSLTKATATVKNGLQSLRVRGSATTSGARFRGEPFAFGNGTRSQRVAALVDEAARASGVDNIYSLVDDVVYDSAGSYFSVINGRRVLSIGDSAFGRTRTGQLLEAAHEIVHAQQFQRVATRRFGGNQTAAADYFFGPDFAFGSQLYARGERVAETVARLRVDAFTGGLSPQQAAASTRYINGWRP